MFKPNKKINENALKKDFFKSKKENKKTFINLTESIESVNHSIVNELKDIEFPEKNSLLFINTLKSRPSSDFVLNRDVHDLFVICSRINKKSFDVLIKKNILGVGISERVLQNNPELYDEIKSKFPIKLNKNHCKILAFKFGSDFIVIEGSGNPSINARNENYIVSNSEIKYNQIKNFFNNAKDY